MDVGAINFNPNSSTANIKVVLTVRADVETYCKCECGKQFHHIDAVYCGNCGRKLNKDAG